MAATSTAKPGTMSTPQSTAAVGATKPATKPATATTPVNAAPTTTPTASNTPVSTQQTPSTPKPKEAAATPVDVPPAPKPARNVLFVPPGSPASPSPAGGTSTELVAKKTMADGTVAEDRVKVVERDGGKGAEAIWMAPLQPSPMGPSEGIVETAAEPINTNNCVPLHDSTSVTNGAPTTPGVDARLSDKMELWRIEAMSQDALYAAKGEELRARTDWYKDGRGDVLVLKDDANSAREALAAHAADPDACPAPPAPERVKLSLITMIENERFFMRSDGHFKGDTPPGATWQKSFAQTLLSCALGPPPAEFPRLVADYHAALAAIRALLPRGVNQLSGHVYSQMASPHFRVRHGVFFPLPKPSDDEDSEPASEYDSTLPHQFSIHNWPTYSLAAKEALENIRHTHVARPLPAFDLSGNLISPARYSELRGATVLASFSIITYRIGSKSANGSEVIKTNVCLDIEYMRVLIAPPQASGSWRKRAPVQLIDPFAVKRRRA